MNFDTLADAYLRQWADKRDEDRWANEQVDSIIQSDADDGWEITLLLVQKAGSDAALAYISAGPLEDLLNNHGSQVIDRIEQECKNNSRLPLALSGVWGINPGHPVFERWYALMWEYGFAEGNRRPL
jgi:hypothetical protein